jgi:type I restriction enzyme, S subunit
MKATEQTCPQNWRLRSLDSLGKVLSGATPSTRVPEFWNGDIAWITPADLSQQRAPFISFTGRSISRKGLESCAATLAPKLNLVISSRAPIGYIAIPKMDFSTNQGCKSLVLGEQQDALFHYYNLHFHVRKLKEKGEGTTFSEISKTTLGGIEVPVPESKLIQSKIGEILLSLDLHIGKVEALIAKYWRLKMGLMHDLLTRGIDEHGQVRSLSTHQFTKYEIGNFPDSWAVVTIEKKLADIIDYRGRTPKKVEAGVPLITAKNVRDGFLSSEPREFIAADNYTEWMTRGIPSCGDVLFTTEAPMGNVARVPDFEIALAQRVLTLVPNRKELDPDYLFWLLHWPRTRERIETLTTGSTVVGVKQSVFRKVLFQFPPLAEQQRIAEVLNSMALSLADKQKMLPKLSGLKTSLMQDLLTGRVPVNSLVQSEAVTAMP